MRILGTLVTAAFVGSAFAQTSNARLPETVTFTEHIAPIVFQSCANCHRKGEIGPFPLTDYRSVRKRMKMIALVTKDRYMPPWHPVKGHGEFMGERRLNDRQITLIQKWVETGGREGDKSKLPPMPKFASGWLLGKPDLVVSMDMAFPVPADGPDIFRNFVIPVGLKEDKYVVAFEFRPSARSVVHHSLVNYDTTGRARRMDGSDGEVGFRGMSSGSGSLGIWAVGAMPHKLPLGLGIHLPKGADLVLSTHFHPSGKAENERTSIGLYFAKEKPKRSIVNLQMPPMWGFVYRIDIPAGEKNYKVRDYAVLPVDCETVEVSSHAHQVCKEMKAMATLPDGKVVKLFYIDDWDFNWQGGYTYKSPVSLPKGTLIEVEFTYDNSADNTDNPNDPPKRIKVGNETSDEMARITLMLVPKDEKDTAMLKRRFARMARAAGLSKRRLIRFDKNGDGFVDKNELPEQYARLWEGSDRNGDGRLSRAELDEGRLVRGLRRR